MATEQKTKRGRPKKIVTEPVEIVKKKRGRKKKEKVIEEIKEKKKRGRKAAVKYFSSSIRKQLPNLTTIVDDTSNYILHLDINNEEEARNDFQNLEMLEKNMYTNIDQDSQSQLVDLDLQVFEKDVKNLYTNIIEKRNEEDNKLKDKLINQTFEFETPTVTKEPAREHLQKLKYVRMLYDIDENDWPTNTEIKCWWCVHSFENVPIGLPLDFIKNKYRCRGIFCSFECMLAYAQTQKNIKMYLINQLYITLTGQDINDKGKLIAAPDKYLLDIFGGPLTIDEFRKANETNKIYKILHYPMFISRDYIEEVDTKKLKDNNQSYLIKQPTSITLDTNLVNNARERMEQSENKIGNSIERYFL